MFKYVVLGLCIVSVLAATSTEKTDNEEESTDDDSSLVAQDGYILDILKSLGLQNPRTYLLAMGIKALKMLPKFVLGLLLAMGVTILFTELFTKATMVGAAFLLYKLWSQHSESIVDTYNDAANLVTSQLQNYNLPDYRESL